MQKMDASISVSLDMDLTFTPAPVQMATSLVKMKSPVTQQASDTKKTHRKKTKQKKHRTQRYLFKDTFFKYEN